VHRVRARAGATVRDLSGVPAEGGQADAMTDAALMGAFVFGLWLPAFGVGVAVGWLIGRRR
jgi:hypothetical protein